MDSSGSCVVINHKTTKFESNSQRKKKRSILFLCCYQLQNLKAIHNPLPEGPTMSPVVINHKTTKFESNSQRAFLS